MTPTTKAPLGRGGYPAKVRDLARRMYAAGYSPYRIHKALSAKGFPAAEDTIRCWADPEYAEARAMSKRTGRAPGRTAKRGYRRRLARMHELRGLGLSYRSIAAVMSNDFAGIRLSEHQVRAIFNGQTSTATIRRLLWPQGAAT